MAGPRGMAKGQGGTTKKTNYYGYSTVDAVDDLVQNDNGSEEKDPVVRNQDYAAIQSVKAPDSALTAPDMGNPVAQANKERLEKKPTFQDLIANDIEIMRQKAQAEKTDAAKLQRYYALADVFNAIGKLGGSAVGGAIKGNVGDYAPAVDPYKESRGYLDAFERAKKANDRLREIDDKSFQLTLRNEEREYNRQLRDADNALRMQLAAIERQWQKDFYDYKSKTEQAIAQGNLELKAKLDAEFAATQQKYALERIEAQNQYNLAEKRISENIVRMQTGGGKGGYGKSTIPFTFNDKSNVDIPSVLYKEMIEYFIDLGAINGEEVDEDNVKSVLRRNPAIVREFLALYGIGDSKPAAGKGSKPDTRIKTGQQAWPYNDPWYVYTPDDVTNPLPDGETPPASGIEEEYSEENDPFAEFVEK